jgi:TolA-binding protein
MRLVMVGGALATLLAGAAGLAPPASAQIDSREGIALQNQILELRRDIQSLRDQEGHDQAVRGSVGSSLGSSVPAETQAAGGGDLSARLLERVSALEDEVRNLRGRIDESDNAHQRAEADLAKQIGDLNFKISNGPVGKGASDSSGAANGPRVAALGATSVAEGAPSSAPAKRKPELIVQEGNAALARRDYAGAEAAAREVLSGPKTPRATDAQFVLAQALAGRRDFAQAAVAYDDAYSRSRTGTHAQDALLGLANSLTAINEKKAACETLAKLHSEFPNPRQDLRDPVAAARQRANCH